MRCIAKQDTGGALAIMNRLYADGKDMGALLDELACLTRDFMILKTAPKEGVSMLSGVVSDREVRELADSFSSGELVRMMNIIQNTVSGFTRSSSRRMDAELCVVNLCQPELDTDTEALIARLTRLEDQIKAGSFTVAVPQPVHQQDAERRPVRQQATDIPQVTEPEREAEPIVDQAPIGFWVDVAEAVRKEVPPALSGFFATSQNAPVRGILCADKLMLACANKFIMDIVNKPDILSLVALKASAKLGRQVRVVVTDQTATEQNNEQMEQLLDFGRAHSDIINIKNQT